MLGTDGVSRSVTGRCPESVRVLLVGDDERWGRRIERRIASIADGFAIERVDAVSTARDRFEATDPDCVVCDGRLGEDGLGFLETVRGADPDIPFVLATGRTDEGLAGEAIDRGATDSVRTDRTPDELLVHRIETAVRTYRAERALARERRRKAAIVDVVAETGDRREALDGLCRRTVADLDAVCAWIASRDRFGTLIAAASGGRDEHLGSLTGRSIDPGGTGESPLDGVGRRDHRLADHPALVAIERDETVSRGPIGTLGADRDPDDWRGTLADHGVEGLVATPIGANPDAALVVEAAGDAFGDDERRRLADHAAAVADVLGTPEWDVTGRDDSGLAIEATLQDPAVPLVALVDAVGADGHVEVRSAVDRGDGATLYLARVPGTDTDRMERAVRAVDGIAFLAAHAVEDGVRCELLAERRTPAQVVLEGGGRVVEALVEDSRVTVHARVPDGDAAAAIGAALDDAFDDPETTLRSSAVDDDERRELLHDLTDRQRDVLDFAYLAGYYETPRGISATELAERFDIARATLTQHLRTAERKVFGEVLTENRG